MKKIYALIIIIFFATSTSLGINENKFACTTLILENSSLTIQQPINSDLPQIIEEEPSFWQKVLMFPRNITAPWGLPTFWFVFVVSAIGTYTLWGIPAGLIAVTIVYFSAKGNKKEFRRALFGWILGTILGGTLKYFIYNL